MTTFDMAPTDPKWPTRPEVEEALMPKTSQKAKVSTPVGGWHRPVPSAPPVRAKKVAAEKAAVVKRRRWPYWIGAVVMILIGLWAVTDFITTGVWAAPIVALAALWGAYRLLCRSINEHEASHNLFGFAWFLLMLFYLGFGVAIAVFVLSGVWIYVNPIVAVLVAIVAAFLLYTIARALFNPRSSLL